MYMLPSNMTIRQCLLCILLWITHKAKKKKQICPLLGFSQKSTVLIPLWKPEIKKKHIFCGHHACLSPMPEHGAHKFSENLGAYVPH
jgi:hypothetical protein